MANKYRIGTSIGIQMNISNMPSETANIFVRSEYGTFDMDNVSVLKDSGDNPIGIKGSFAGANQKYVGKYDVIVICSTRRLCVDNAFELVKHSDEADTTETTTVDLNFTASYLTFPTVVSGYEEWRQDHDGTIEDYWDFVREEPRIVQIENDIQINKKAIQAEVERATAAEAELGDAIDAEKERAEAAEEKISGDLSAEITRATTAEKVLQDNIETVSSGLADEIERATNREDEIDNKHTRGKIFCNGILEYKQTPSEDGYYLQKDIDGDLVCIAKHTSGTTGYIDAPIGKLFVVDDNLYVCDAFKIIPVGYTDTVIVAATPMDNAGDIYYTITGNNLESPSKKIELTSIK